MNKEALCMSNAAGHLSDLIATAKYSWCNIDDSLKQAVVWFDPNKSWATARWFDPSSLSSRINYAPYIIFSTQQLIFMIVSVIANSYILYYHFTRSPHPKFCMSLMKRICIRVHVTSGAIGVLLPLYVFFSTNVKASIICMYVFAAWDLIFSVSAFYQAPAVLGVRCITVPLYYVCIGTKTTFTFCLIASLLVEPLGGFKSQVEWLWLCWVIHQTYAWVRIWYSTFFWMEAVLDHQYTVAVFLAGSMCAGAAVGFYLWLLWILLMALSFIVIDRRVKALHCSKINDLMTLSGKKKLSLEESNEMRSVRELGLLWEECQANCWRNSPDAAEFAYCELKSLLTEHQLYDLLKPDERNVINYSQADAETPLPIKAKLLFDFIDEDKVGYLSKENLTHFIIGFGVSVADADKLFFEKNIAHDNRISLSEFETGFKPFFLYAFSGLLDWVAIADAKNDRNILEEIIAKERLIKCPFARFSMDSRPLAFRRMNAGDAEVPRGFVIPEKYIRY